MSEEYVGQDRRNADGTMGIVISGSRVPMAIFLSAIATLIASIVYATVWLTKLDERVMHNAKEVARATAINSQQTDAIIQIQRNADRTALILENITKRLSALEDTQ